MAATLPTQWLLGLLARRKKWNNLPLASTLANAIKAPGGGLGNEDRRELFKSRR